MSKNQVIVIGGGPAGLIAAGQAAATGAETLLLEKMSHPGRKLLITGKGRCNLTNVAPLEEFIEHFSPDGRFLRSAFTRFFTDELIEFFDELGVETVLERGERIYPVSNDAQDIVDALNYWVQKNGAKLRTQAKVERLLVEHERVVGVQVANSPGSSPKPKSNNQSKSIEYRAKSVIIATGGAFVPIRPALVPLETSGNIAPRLQGLSLRNVNARLIVDGNKQAEAFGEMLFTHFGLSGPIILSLSRKVVDALRAKHEVVLSIDLKPALDDAKLDARLMRDFDTHGKRQYRTLLQELLPRKLIPVCINLTGIPQDKRAHQITSDERKRLRTWLKDFRFHISGHRSFAQAIVTAGGVTTREVNPRSMASLIVDGLYFAGEVLDLDADTGGYNLQAAFSTGWLAGLSAAKSK
jgi:predicted Rossmann fold flavoprotein